MTLTPSIEVSVNVYADPGTDFLMPWGTACGFALNGLANARSLEVFTRKEDYLRSDIRIACPGLIPVGAFATEEEEREVLVLRDSISTSEDKAEDSPTSSNSFSVELSVAALQADERVKVSNPPTYEKLQTLKQKYPSTCSQLCSEEKSSFRHH